MCGVGHTAASSRAQTSQIAALRFRLPSEATTRMVPGRTPQMTHVAPAVANGDSFVGKSAPRKNLSVLD